MPRIFKGSESTLRLLISKTGDYQALTEIKIKLYTTDIENAIEIIDGIQVCKNIAIITLAPRAFMGMEDGLINYIIDGATEDDVFHTERQSNYMLKSLSYINEDGVATQTMTIESNGEYRVTPNDGLYVDINVNVPDLNGSYDDGFNVGYGQGKTDGANEQKSKLETINITENGTYTKEDGYNQIEVNVPDLNGSYDEGYGQGKTDGANEQKSKLVSINITENGTYTKEDGYNQIEVNVPDLNGSYDDGFNVGYGQGKTDGVNEQKSKLVSINITENGTYTKEDGYNQIEVNVPDLNGSYDVGKTDGINEQKSKLESINITENGTYTKEDGYNHIEVNVPDLNGSYDNGYADGEQAGYNSGYSQGQAYVAANARVLNVTENGVYRSKFSDPIMPTLVTGVYADGTNFYNYAELNGKIFNTKIAATVDSRLEFWYKGDNISKSAYDVIIGAGNIDKNNCFRVRYYNRNNNILWVEIGDSKIQVNNWDDTIWHHLIISKAEGLWIDGEKRGNFSPTNTISGKFYINGIDYDYHKTANGYFGMIKINDVVIIPTADGFLDTNTGKLLKVVRNGTYTFTENLPIYGEGELYKTINVNVPDLNGSYDEGYNQGKTDGANEQKSKLVSINITENGTYTKEDGYNQIEVNVADLNGSYDEGYNQGQADVAANARVLNVTENGVYASKYTKEEEIVMPFDLWGDDFYSYAYVKNKMFNTGIIPNKNTRLEFWFKPDEGDYTKDGSVVIMNNANSTYGNFFGIFHSTAGNQSYYANVGSDRVNFNLTNGVLYHIVLSVADGLVINGEQIGTFSSSSNFSEPLYINGMSNDLNASADGEFGMIKIDDTIIIPTENGFLNQNTNELLEVVYDVGSYKFTEISKPTIEGNLYRTINVDVIPKVNIQEAGINFAYSTFTEVPEWADFNGVTNMNRMFQNCSNLQTIPEINTSNATNMSNMFGACNNLRTIPLIDTSNVTDMNYMFANCRNLQTIPPLNTSNVTNMNNMFYYCSNLKTIPQLNTSNVTNMGNMFAYCGNLQTIPPINTSNVTDMGNMFNNCNNLRTLPELDASKVTTIKNYFRYGGNNLTDVGGWKNLKCDWNDNYGLVLCPNLTYQSCINILNGLYDFVGNGSTETRTLKVHQNFLTTVGNEISIGTSKGWTITA